MSRPTKYPTLNAMKEEARPGCCVVCDARLPAPASRRRDPRGHPNLHTGAPRVICLDPECWVEWERCRSADRNAVVSRARRARREQLNEARQPGGDA